MEDPITELEKQVQQLNAEVHKLRQLFIYGLSGLGVVLLVGLCAPALGAFAIILALAVILIVVFAATIGRSLGWLVTSVRNSAERRGHRRP